MKMRKKLAALLAAAMIASVMPMSVFADSTNRVDKVVTVEKDTNIKAASAPDLKIKMKDDLTQGLSFYLELTGAEWAPIHTEEVTATVTVATTSPAMTFNPTGFSTPANSSEGFFLNLTSATTTVPSSETAEAATRLAKAEVAAEKAAKEAAKKIVGDISAKTEAYNLPVKAIEFTVGTGTFEAYRENDTRMAIKLIGGTFAADQEFVFPLLAKVTDSEASVKVIKYDTEVSNSEHLFSVSDASVAKVVVGDVPNFYRTTEIAPITLQELFANSIKNVATNERWFTLELRDTDFAFDVTDDARFEGEIAYRTLNRKIAAAEYELSNDRTRLGIKIDGLGSFSSIERGNLVLKGINVIAARDARNGEVKAVIESKKLFDKDTIVIANRGDYKTKLDVPKDWKYEVVAGTEKEVKFILSEELANSLTGTRPVTFAFDQGVKIKTNVNSTSKNWDDSRADYILWGADGVQLDKLIDDVDNSINALDLAKAQAALYKYLYGYNNGATSRPGATAINVNKDIISIKGEDVQDADKGVWDTQLKRVHIANDRESFTVDNFEVKQDKAGKYTFTTTLLVPANVTGDIKVAVVGSGVTEEEIVILKAEAPVTVTTTGMDIKVGLKEIETTGKITIKETAKERISQGKNIVTRIADIDSGLKIKSFKATVVEGDLVLEDRKDTDLAIGVKRVSTEPSTIEITDIVMSTDRTVPEGKYDLVIGGNAISSITGRHEFAKNDHFDIDPVVVVKEFINITTKNTEDLQGSANKAEVGFVVGSDQYTINGKVETMDAPPYIENGRTMVSIKYVAQALGVDADKVIWDQANQTATIIADKVVQVKLGNKAMIVNGVSLPMEVAAELKNDRTFVPMGSIARALNVIVDWDETTKAVTFNPKTK